MNPAQHDALAHKHKRMVGGQALNTSMRQSTAGRRLKVLDMGCGKGGDLKKWAKVGTGEYVGFGKHCSLPLLFRAFLLTFLTLCTITDIAEMSVEEAKRRYNTSRPDQRPGSASFKVLDCFSVRFFFSTQGADLNRNVPLTFSASRIRWTMPLHQKSVKSLSMSSACSFVCIMHSRTNSKPG